MFPFPSKRLLNSNKGISPYCKLKTLFKSLGKIVKQLSFKDVLRKKLSPGIFY